MMFKYLKISRFKYFVIGGLFLASSLLLSDSLAYDDKTTHPDLTREIITFYELSTGKNFTDEQKQWVIGGSRDEDRAPRWLNHFYDPIYERGLTTETVGINGYLSKNWAQFSSYQTINPANIGNLWSGNGPVVSGSFWGDFSYEAAVKDYSKDKEKEAYVSLGHVLHLIEDITVPEHTRNDPHPGEPRPSYYENWTKNNSSGLTQDLGKRLFNQGSRPVIYVDLGSYFNNLAAYTNTHFFSPRTINSEIYQKPKIVYEDGTFAYGKDENGELFDLAIVRSDRKSGVKSYIVSNDQVLQEYWLRLSRQAVVNGAGVIQLFLNQAEAAKQVELAKQKVDAQQAAQKSSLISQIYDFFTSPEAPASEPTLVTKSEPVKSSPKIVKQKDAAKQITVQKPAASTPTQQKLALNPIPTPTPNLTQTPAPAPRNGGAPQNQSPQNAAPVVYTGGGGGGSSSNTQNSSNVSTPNQEQSSGTGQAFQAGDLVINEIMYNPAGIDDKHEWVELYNNSGHSITLTGGTNGWKFDDGASSFHGLNEPPANGSQGSMAIAAGGYIVLADNAATFLTDYSGYSGAVVDTVMDLKNSTSTIKAIKIIAPGGTVIDSVLYSNSWGADGNGKTLERKSAVGGSNDAANWGFSSVNGGTPGAVNNWFTVSTTTLETATSTLAAATSTLATATSIEPVLTGLGTDISATTTIAENTIWTLTNSPYRLFFDSTKHPIVAPGAILTIEPGVKIIPQGGGYSALQIQGTLNAIATSGAPIIFTSIADADDSASTTPQKGDWLNIAFTQGSQGNLDYVEFRYGGQGLERPVKEMVKIIGATVNINHSNFTNSQSIALRLVDSNGAIENSTFTDNACGVSVDSLVNGDGTTDGGCMGSSGYFPAVATTTPQIKNNKFIRNRLTAIETRNGASPIIDSNTFTDNGYPVRIESSYPTITNSQIANSTTSPNILNGIAIDGYTHFRKDFTLKKDLPYILETNGSSLSPYVDAGATLTLEPGAIFKTGHTYTALNVNGIVIASTTPDNPIVFTSLKDDTRGGDTNGDGAASMAQDSDWASIKFFSGSIGSFVNAIFSYGGFGFVAPPQATSSQLLTDAVNSGSWRQWGPSGTIILDSFAADHGGAFEKIIIHDFMAFPSSPASLNVAIKNSAGETAALSETILLNQMSVKTEFAVNLSGNFIAGETYAPQISWTNTPGGIGAAVTAVSLKPSAAFYELLSPPAPNPALSIDAGAAVVVQ